MHANHSSKLKRKQSIINKLKFIRSESFPQLLVELENENFNKFHTEIVNNLLTNPSIATPPQPLSLSATYTTFQCIHMAVEVIYLFSFDTTFMNYLISYSKKNHTENWTMCCILLEAFLLSPKSKKTPLEAVVGAILKSLKTNQLPFILYVLEAFAIDTAVFIPFIKSEIQAVKEDDLELLTAITGILGITDDLHVCRSYVEVIKPIPGEFSFYEDTPVPTGVSIPPSFTHGILKNIEKRELAPCMLDFIGQSIYGHPELIAKLMNKKKHIEFIPRLARILSKAIKGNKTYCSSILASRSTERDLLLIAECYKFGLFSPQDLFELLNQFIERNLISELCVMLENLGRFIFYRKETNLASMEMLERVRQSPLTSLGRIQFSQCISMILNPEFCRFNINDFLRWFINTGRYKTSLIFDEIRKSRRLLLLILAHPSFFENPDVLRAFVAELDTTAKQGTGSFSDSIIDFYLTVIPSIYEEHRALAFAYANALSAVAHTPAEQERVMGRLLTENIGDGTKYRMMLGVLDRCDRGLQGRYLEILKQKQREDAEYQAMVFNLCEKHGHGFMFEESDSFEREMALMDDED